MAHIEKASQSSNVFFNKVNFTIPHSLLNGCELVPFLSYPWLGQEKMLVQHTPYTGHCSSACERIQATDWPEIPYCNHQGGPSENGKL